MKQPNPSSSSAVCFGEMLYDHLPEGRFPGGAPMNVALHMQQQGVETRFISAVGQDEAGDALLAYLDERGLSTELIQRDPEHDTSKVIADVTQADDVKYEILQPVAWDFIRMQEAAARAVQETDLLLYGSLAGRHEVTRRTLRQLIPRARRTAFDVNLRAPHYTSELIEELLGLSGIVKVNEEEFALLSEWFLDGATDEGAMRKFTDQFGIETLCITQGEKGAGLLHDGQLYQQPGFRVTVADTVGSGDAFLGTLLTQLLQGHPPQECLRYGCAVGAYVATQAGATPRIDDEAIEKIIQSQP